MKYRTLGRTGLRVSEVGFGTIPILKGSVPVLPAYFNLEEEEALTVLNHAFRLGCNLFDTAIVPEYGDAEIKLGKFAACVGRERIVISDKARFYGGSEMYRAVAASNENLGTYADLYFVHQVDPEHADEVFGKGGALDALAELKREGRIRFAGVASHYYDILLRGAGDDRVDVLQGSGNLVERGMLDRMKEEPLFAGKGFLVNKVYAAGLLPRFFPPELLIRAVLVYPVSSALIGIGTLEQADAAFGKDAEGDPEGLCLGGAAEPAAIPSFQDALSVLEKEVTLIPGESTLIPGESTLIPCESTLIPCDRCQRCVCPWGTEVHTLFRQYLYFFLGKEYWSLRKLELGIEESAARCRQCTAMPCLEMCPRGIRITDEVQKVLRLVRSG